MVASKRRPASTRAVSRKAEGIEPRNTRNRKDDAFKSAEVNTSTAAKGKEVLASSGSETMARVTLRLHGNPGGPAAAFHRSTVESMPNNRRKGGRQNQRQGVGSSNSTSEGG